MKQKITFGSGLNADTLPSELADGFFNDCSNIRAPRNGFAEIVGGVSSTVCTFTGNNGGSLSQLYTSANTYVVCSTNNALGVYTVGGSSTPDSIIRKTEGVAIASATAAGTTVTITTTGNHGLVTTNVVSAWGFTPSSYNVESASITRISATVFTYVVPVAPAVTPATNLGMYSDDASTSHVNVTRGGELSGVLILNSTTAGCYYWGGNISIPLRKVVGSYTARVSVPFGNFIIQLAPTISSVEYPFRICWSNASEPGTVPHNGFTAAATNQAGDVDKPEIGEMVWAEKLGDDLVVYGRRGRLLMRYVGGNDVFSFTRLIGDEGVYSAEMAVETPIGHVFVDRDKHVRIHSGGATKDISMGRVQSILGQSSVGVAGVTVSWIVSHPRQNEVWIGYLETVHPAGFDSSFALVWNWVEDTWGKVTVSNKNSGISVRTASSSTNMALYFSGGTASAIMAEYDAAERAPTTASITREGLDAGDDDVIKNLQRSRWNIDSNSSVTPGYTVEHGSSMFADTAATFATPVTYTVGTTDYCNARATGGRFMAVRLNITTSGASSDFPYYALRVRSADIDFTLGGKR